MSDPASTAGPPGGPAEWDERYGADEYVYGTAPNDFLASVAGRIPPGRVLCLAEGEGRNSVFLAGLGYEVTGVDSSAVGLAKVRRLAEERGVEVRTVVADLAELAIEPGAWSGVVSIFAHLPAEVRRELHRRVVEGLAPGGALVLEAYTPEQLELKSGGPPTSDRLMTLAALREELAELRIEIGHEIRREIHEGRLHNGVSSVVQVLAFKPA